MGNVVKLNVALTMRCSACGAEARAACDCRAPYMPAGKLAAAAIEANPNMSNRAIAKKTGLSEPTIRRVRTSGASNDAPPVKVNDHNKKYPRAKRKKPEKVKIVHGSMWEMMGGGKTYTEAEYRAAYVRNIINTAKSAEQQAGVLEGPYVDGLHNFSDMLHAAERVVDVWTVAVNRLRRLANAEQGNTEKQDATQRY